MIQNNTHNTIGRIRSLYMKELKDIYCIANESINSEIFKNKIKDYLCSNKIINQTVKRHILELINYDGYTIYELSKNENIKLETITLLWKFLNEDSVTKIESFDLYFDLFYQLKSLYKKEDNILPTEREVKHWMKRWPSGLDKDIIKIRDLNKERIIRYLVKKIESRHSLREKYIFKNGMNENDKIEQVKKWWEDFRFHLTFAIKSFSELNKMLDYTLSNDVMKVYKIARKKDIPIFVTPYYLSLLNIEGEGFNDATIRSYIIYSENLVRTFGKIKAWEREDLVTENTSNIAGWLLPQGNNIHRRYPEVAIFIPDTIGRACGGLCASCQRMYDFQSKHFNFDFENLIPKENWNHKLKRLMEYFRYDTQIRDILITGGDALMSQNKSLHTILEAVYNMAAKKRKDNEGRGNGEKYAEIQRIRLGTRLPVYLPMRISEELVTILHDFKEKAKKIGIKQFIIQTHYQSPLEITPEAKSAISKLLSSGWSITNQLVYNVAASRRGHTAKLRKELNELGIISYYTFTVKGFEENYDLFAPNSRSVQEAEEEKKIGRINNDEIFELESKLETDDEKAKIIKDCCRKNKVPFIATDRSVLNLPGIGKSMTFTTVGIDKDGKRILQFDHDATRRHSPIIEKIGKVYIKENKSINQYLEQLKLMNENINDYKSIWNYTEGKTEERFPFFNYPNSEFTITDEYSNLSI